MATPVKTPSGALVDPTTGALVQEPPTQAPPTATNAPAAQAPVTPAPQIQTPATPSASSGGISQRARDIVDKGQAVYVDPNSDLGMQIAAYGYQKTQDSYKNNPYISGASASMPKQGMAGAAPATAGQAAAPTLPNTVSVVDLLNAAGQSSDFASRSQLAKQFGIQGYTGTASQNIDLGKKFREFYEANKGTKAPESPAEARTALEGALGAEAKTEDPTKQFFDIFGAMNPVEANLYQQMSGFLSSITTKQSLTELFQQETKAQGIPELKMELADINRIMEGTEADIRAEISNAGGFATESQVQALSSARNKTLLRKAAYLSDIIDVKNDYVDQVVSLTKADRETVSKELDQKLGITEKLFDMSKTMQNSAKENYQQIIDKVGWDGLASTLKGNPTQLAKVEKMFGLMPGEIQFLSDVTTEQLKRDKKYQFQTLTSEDAFGNKVQRIVALDPTTGAQVGTVGQSVQSGGIPSTVSAKDRQSALSGEFGSVINAAAGLVGAERGKTSRASIADAIASKDYASAYAQVANNVEESLTGEVKTRFANARTDYNVMAGLKSAIEKYSEEGGNMGLLRGKEEEIKRKLGIDSGKATEAAVQLWREFQVYRLNMTGAAFSPAESKDYAAVNPTLGKSLDLNMSVINGAMNQLENRVTATVNTRVPNAKILFDKVSGTNPSDGLTDDEAYELYKKKTQ